MPQMLRCLAVLCQWSIKKYLGKDYQFNPEKVDYQDASCPQYYYNKDSKTFKRQETVCGWTCGPRTQYEITKATEANGILEIIIKVVFYKNNTLGYFGDYAKTNQIMNGIEGVIPFEKGSTYKFTFKYEDGNYVFVSSEPVSA